MKLLYAYLAIAILTFGASWNHNPITPESMAKEPAYRIQSYNAQAAFVCAVAWPLYWSYRLFAEIEPPKEGVKLEVGS